MSTYHSFDEKKISGILEELSKRASENASASQAQIDTTDTGELSISAGCISVVIENGHICLDLPVVGQKCIPIPLPFPDSTVAKACLSICTRFFIPTGVRITVEVEGEKILEKVFGSC